MQCKRCPKAIITHLLIKAKVVYVQKAANPARWRCLLSAEHSAWRPQLKLPDLNATRIHFFVRQKQVSECSETYKYGHKLLLEARTSKRQLRFAAALRTPESPAGRPSFYLKTFISPRWFRSKGSDCCGKNLQAAPISTMSTLLEKTAIIQRVHHKHFSLQLIKVAVKVTG